MDRRLNIRNTALNAATAALFIGLLPSNAFAAEPAQTSSNNWFPDTLQKEKLVYTAYNANGNLKKHRYLTTIVSFDQNYYDSHQQKCAQKHVHGKYQYDILNEETGHAEATLDYQSKKDRTVSIRYNLVYHSPTMGTYTAKMIKGGKGGESGIFMLSPKSLLVENEHGDAPVLSKTDKKCSTGCKIKRWMQNLLPTLGSR